MATCVNQGFVMTAQLLTGVGSPVAFAYMGLGTGSNAEATTVSALATEVTDSGLSRVSATAATASSATAGDTAKYSYTWTATGTKSVKEAAVFNSSANGSMLCYATFDTAVPMQSADTLAVFDKNCGHGKKFPWEKKANSMKAKLFWQYANVELNWNVMFHKCVETIYLLSSIVLDNDIVRPSRKLEELVKELAYCN